MKQLFEIGKYYPDGSGVEWEIVSVPVSGQVFPYVAVNGLGTVAYFTEDGKRDGFFDYEFERHLVAPKTRPLFILWETYKDGTGMSWRIVAAPTPNHPLLYEAENTFGTRVYFTSEGKRHGFSDCQTKWNLVAPGTQPIFLLEKIYDGGSLVDIERDIHEAVSEGDEAIPTDLHGFPIGKFAVTITWTPN